MATFKLPTTHLFSHSWEEMSPMSAQRDLALPHHWFPKKTDPHAAPFCMFPSVFHPQHAFFSFFSSRSLVDITFNYWFFTIKDYIIFCTSLVTFHWGFKCIFQSTILKQKSKDILISKVYDPFHWAKKTKKPLANVLLRLLFIFVNRQ